MLWATSSALIRSPLVRLAAAVPTVGYFILYGDAFSSMFDFSESLGSSHLLFDAQTKMRLIYYGGILITAALILYLWKCPKTNRRHHNASDAIDEFARTGSAIDLASHQLDTNLNNAFHLEVFNDANYSQPLDLLRQILSHIDDHRLRQFMADYESEWTAVYELDGGNHANRIVPFIQLNVPKTGIESKASESEFGKVYDAILVAFYYECADKPGVISAANAMINSRWYMNEYANPLAQYSVKSLSIIGAALALLPAIDVFLQVVILDVAGLLSQWIPAYAPSALN